MKLQVGIVFGGKSVEHDISIITALQVMNAIDQSIYDIIPIYLTKDNNWLTSSAFKELSTFKEGVEVLKEKEEIFFYKNKRGYYFRPLYKRFAKSRKIDLILPTVHGLGVEDGTISGFFEILGIPITSADVGPSALVQDKAWTKSVLMHDLISTLPFISYKKDDDISNLNLSSFPLIIKPARLGSSIGIKIVKEKDELKEALDEALRFDDKVIIEQKLKNYREFNCAVLKTNKGYLTSEVEEIKINHEFYAFSDKYEDEKVQIGKISDLISRSCPAEISENLTNEIKTTALQTFKALELKGVARVDFLYDLDNLKLFVNEVNTIPGALSFYLFDRSGLTFPELINQLIKNAIIENLAKSSQIRVFTSSILNRKSLKINK